jgi:penicillin-binding protein 1A
MSRRKRFSLKTKRGTKRFHWFRAIFLGILLSLPFAVVGGGIYTYMILRDLPDIHTLKDYRPSITTRIYADDGRLIDEFFIEDRRYISIDRVPRYVAHAFVAAEDSRFFQHEGIDYYGMIRAMIKNLTHGAIVQGGSTITQQLAKTIYLSPERNLTRKIREAVLAYRMDRYLKKYDILNLYLNQIYLGHGTYGIEAASQCYFGKSSINLNLAEAALLAGLPKAPSRYSPFVSLERAKQRQTYALNRMLEDRYITGEERDRALKTRIRLNVAGPKGSIAPYFTENVRRYIMAGYGSEALYREGFQVYTTLNVEMQKAAFAAVQRGLRELEQRRGIKAFSDAHPPVQAALFCMDAKTGEIKAMVGGRDFKKSEFNRATQSRRQPGSSFKPIIYAAAFDKGLTPATIIMDSPIIFQDSLRDSEWAPKNFDSKYHGPTTLRDALTYSRNVVTIKVLKDIGVRYAADYARNMGIESRLSEDLSMALGTSSLSLQEMVRAFGVLANEGKKVEPYFIRRIVDRTGNVFEESTPKVEQVIDSKVAFITTSILQDVVQRGTGWRVKSLGRPAAGKTGTTDEYKDAWFIGYTPSLVAGVWVGYDDSRSLGRSEVGGVAAAPIWLYFMESALADQPVEDFPVPEDIAIVKIDPQTGLLARPFSSNARSEYFLEGTEPSEYAPSDLERWFKKFFGGTPVKEGEYEDLD